MDYKHMYHGIFKHLILFKSDLNHSKCRFSNLLTLIESLSLLYLKQMFVKNSTGNKMTDYWTSWLKRAENGGIVTLKLCEWLGRVYPSINSYKYIFNYIKNTTAILLITARIAICSAISLREPITFELDDEIPALYQINTFSQRVHMSLHSNKLPLFRANQYLIERQENERLYIFLLKTIYLSIIYNQNCPSDHLC
jgi:hypothetical protein